MTCSGLVTNETCLFSCNDGYEMQGSERRTCLNSAEWDGDETFCKGEQRRGLCKTQPLLNCCLQPILLNNEIRPSEFKLSHIWLEHKSVTLHWVIVMQCHQTIFCHLTLITSLLSPVLSEKLWSPRPSSKRTSVSSLLLYIWLKMYTWLYGWPLWLW